MRPRVLCVRCSDEHMPLFRDDNELSSTAPKGKRDGSHAPVWSELFQIGYNPGCSTSKGFPRYSEHITSVVFDTTCLASDTLSHTMATEIDHAPPHVPSYHTDFQNTTITSTKTNLSVSTTCEYKFFSRTTGMIDFEGEPADLSEETTLPENGVGPIVALSTADSIVVPSLDLQEGLPSTDTTAVSRVEPTAVFVSSMWSKSFDSVVSSISDLQQNRSTDTNIESTHCSLGGHHTIPSSPYSTLSGVHDVTTARNNSTSSRLVLDTTDHTAIGSYTKAQEPRISAAPSSGDGTVRPSAQVTKPRSQGDLPVAATEASTTAVPYQSLEKSRYGEIDRSTIRPYGTVPIVTHSPGVSLVPQTTICTSETWNPTGLPNTNTRTENATNGSVSAPSAPPIAPPIAPPTFASTGPMTTSRYIWVLICLWTMSMFHT
jgi:hypothetical protein